MTSSFLPLLCLEPASCDLCYQFLLLYWDVIYPHPLDYGGSDFNGLTVKADLWKTLPFRCLLFLLFPFKKKCVHSQFEALGWGRQTLRTVFPLAYCWELVFSFIMKIFLQIQFLSLLPSCWYQMHIKTGIYAVSYFSYSDMPQDKAEYLNVFYWRN